MSKPWFALLAVLCAGCIVCGIGWALPVQEAGTQPQNALYLTDDRGQVALFSQGETQPRRVYPIYTHLLPPCDVEQLRQGIPVQSDTQLEQLLEDFGL